MFIIFWKAYLIFFEKPGCIVMFETLVQHLSSVGECIPWTQDRTGLDYGLNSGGGVGVA